MKPQMNRKQATAEVKSGSGLPFDQVVTAIQECISIHSLSGKEEQMVKYMARLASRLGFPQVKTDRMGNLIAEAVIGTGRGPKIILTGHTDTVNADPSGWDPETQPWSGAVRDGRLYGRGAADMKSSLMAQLFAAASVFAAPENCNGRIYVVGTVAEELFEGICFSEALRQIQPDHVIVGEATNGCLNIGQRGRAEIVITSFGQPQHASTGRSVINAIEQMAYIIDAFHRWYRSDVDQILGKRNIVPTDIKIPVGGGGGADGRGGNSTVPSMVEINYDIRTLEGDTAGEILKLIRDNIEIAVRNGRRKYPNFRDPRILFASDVCTTWTGVRIEQDKFAPAWKTDPESHLVKKAIQGIKKMAGYEPELGHYSFCTDGSGVVRYKEIFPEANVDIIGFGPGHEEDAHTINESIDLNDLKKAYLGFQGICRELLR